MVEFEVVIEHLKGSWEKEGTKQRLFLNEEGYQKCKSDLCVKIIAMGTCCVRGVEYGI